MKKGGIIRGGQRNLLVRGSKTGWSQEGVPGSEVDLKKKKGRGRGEHTHSSGERGKKKKKEKQERKRVRARIRGKEEWRPRSY